MGCIQKKLGFWGPMRVMMRSNEQGTKLAKGTNIYKSRVKLIFIVSQSRELGEFFWRRYYLPSSSLIALPIAKKFHTLLEYNI